MSRTKVFLACLTVCSPLIIYAQKVTVAAKTERIRSESAAGSATVLSGPAEAVEAAWNRYCKDLGKAKAAGEFMVFSKPVLGGTVYEKGTLYTKISTVGGQTTVWAGLLESEWSVNDVSLVYSELEQWVYRFGVKFYRDQIQNQIDEAQRAVEAVERARQRLTNQNKDLSGKITANEAEKVRLEKQLENNRVEHASLLVRLENNRKAQDSVAAAIIPIKNVLELHQERQRKVN